MFVAEKETKLLRPTPLLGLKTCRSVNTQDWPKVCPEQSNNKIFSLFSLYIFYMTEIHNLKQTIHCQNVLATQQKNEENNEISDLLLTF